MEISTTKEADRNRNDKETSGRMEVEITVETDEAKRRQHETSNIPQYPETSMSVGMGDKSDKTLAGNNKRDRYSRYLGTSDQDRRHKTCKGVC